MKSDSGFHPVTVDFYFKDDCHLCEQMKKSLSHWMDRTGSSENIRIIMHDIEDKPEWFDLYREYVPVLVVDDEEVCHYFFDAAEFSTAVSRKADTQAN